MEKPLMHLALAALAAFAIPLASAAAATLPGQSTFEFTGICADCTGSGVADLVLSDYTEGSTIDSTNFVSFTYNGTDLQPAFTITKAQASSLSGSMTPPYPAVQDFFITGNGEIFSSSVFGDWCVGGACLADYGFSHNWTLLAAASTGVPEPFTLSLLATPLLAAAALRRRSRYQSALSTLN